MADKSKIEWTDATFNPWVGCTKVSPACDHCYAESWAKRSGMVQWGNAPRRRTSVANWNKPLKWNRQAEKDGRRIRVFCASLADVFDNQVPKEWRTDLWTMIIDTPYLDWQLLTKRPQNIRKMMPSRLFNYDNIWIGTTVENKEEAERRAPYLRELTTNVRFLSIEPLLEDLGNIDLTGVDWVIVGGESGPGARVMKADWARNIRNQCKAAGVAFFMKQMTKKAPIPDDLLVREYPV